MNNTTLHSAVMYGNDYVVSALIEKGADVDFVNVDGQTPLHLACYNKCFDLVKRLLEDTDCSMKIIDNYGCMPLDVTQYFMYNNIKHYLIQKGAWMTSDVWMTSSKYFFSYVLFMISFFIVFLIS